MIKYIHNLIYIAILIVTLSSCGARKSTPVLDEVAWQTNKQADIKGYLIAQRNDWTALKASLRAEISIGSKSFSSRVALSAARGQGLRLSVIPFPLVEAARLWFTPEGITFVDLIHGRYASETYASLSERLGFVLGYEQIEALFLAKVFAPNEVDQEAGVRKLKHLVWDTKHILEGRLEGYSYFFTLSAVPLNLESFVISDKSSKQERFRASYSGYKADGGAGQMPQEFSLELYKPESNRAALGKLTLQYNKVTALESAEGLGLTPKIKPQYERIDLGQIIQLIKQQ